MLELGVEQPGLLAGDSSPSDDLLLLWLSASMAAVF